MGIDLDVMMIFDFCCFVIDLVLECYDFDYKDMWVFVNLIGKFVIGGFMGDVGLIGCKIIVDIYGGMVCYGGGVFFGKDLFKVDCFGVYVMCWVVKNVVVVGLVDCCEC